MSEERIQQLKAFLEEEPDNSFLTFALGLEYVKQDRLDEARGLFEKVQQKDPQYIGVYYHLGKLYESLGENKKAVDTYRCGIEIARKAGDQHSASELQEALAEWES